MNDYGYIGKRYILSFILIFGLLLLFLFVFFYFNIYLVIVTLSVIFICLLILIFSNKEKKVIEDSVLDEEVLEDKIQERDGDFSLDLFKVYIKDVLELISKGYSNNTTSYLTNFVGKDLIEEINKNINTYKENDYTRMITSINIRDSKLVDYYIQSGYEYFQVEASISKVDCEVQNGVVISGAPSNGKFMDYNLLLCRTIKEYTPNTIEKCPICGSNNMSEGKCLNCSSLVINEDGFYLIKINQL